MGATDFDQSRVKLIVMVIAVVVILHVLTAVTLAMVQTPAPVIKPAKIMPPIEIEMITLTPPIEVEEVVIEQIKDIERKPEPVKKVKVQPTVKPVAAAKPKLVEKSKPVDKVKTVDENKPAAKKIVEPITKKDKPIVIKTKPELISNQSAVTVEKNNTQLLPKANQPTEAELTAKRLEAERQRKVAEQADADNKAALQKESLRKEAFAQAQKEAKEKAAQQQAAADIKAREAEKAAQAKADAASNEPISFTAGNASWASTPNFSFPSRAERGASSGDTFTVGLLFRVNKQGGIESVSVSRSSGNPFIDKAAIQQARQGKFKPFTKDGVPRVGNVTLSVSYKMP